MISSRKQTNVDNAVAQLRERGLTVSGIACHVGKKEQRLAMLEKVQYQSNDQSNCMKGQICLWGRVEGRFGSESV